MAKSTKKAISASGLEVRDYLLGHQGEQVTAADIAAELGKTDKSVNAIVTAALQNKGYSERIPGEITLADGTHKPVKFIQLTEAGVNYDHESALAADAAAAAAKAAE